jgi:hypothetical protein
MKRQRKSAGSQTLAEGAGRALRRAARRAQETARQYGTPVWVISDGRLVALQPPARPARPRQ